MKKIYFFIVLFIQTIVSLFLVVIFNRNGAARKVRRLKNDRKGRAATVLANGPSAREIIISRGDLLNGTDLLVLNNFGNQEYFFKLKPRYYIILDPAYYNSEIKVESEKNTNNDRRDEHMLQENLKKVDWDMILFMPSLREARKSYSLYGSNPHISVVPFNTTRIMGFDRFQNFLIGCSQGLPSSRNVIIPAMILMANLGYKTIYLYGCEFSWTKTMDVDPNNGMMFFNDRHFYNKEEMRYFGKGGYVWWLDAISEMLHGTEQVSKFADSIGVRIINRTKGSFIDSFEYENPDTI